jgi:hypothetical protein
MGDNPRFFVLQNPRLKKIFGELPIDILHEIDNKVIQCRNVDFCKELLSITPKADMSSEEFLKECSNFIERIQEFIEKMGTGDINPANLDECLYVVERQCIIVLKEMVLYNHDHDHEPLKRIADELRDILVYLFSENRLTVTKVMLEGEGLQGFLDISKVPFILKSVEWVILMCGSVLKANTNSTVQSFETHAVTLLEECSDILVALMNNKYISPSLKRDTFDVFTYLMTDMFSIFEQAQEQGVGSEVQILVYQKYKQLKIKYNKLKQEYFERRGGGGGEYNIQQKNNSKRRVSKRKSNKNKNTNNTNNGNIRKKKKIKKKTLRLRIKK